MWITSYIYRQSSTYTVLYRHVFLNNTVYFGTLISPFSTKSLLRLHSFLLTRLFFQSLKKQYNQRTVRWSKMSMIDFFHRSRPNIYEFSFSSLKMGILNQFDGSKNPSWNGEFSIKVERPKIVQFDFSYYPNWKSNLKRISVISKYSSWLKHPYLRLEWGF